MHHLQRNNRLNGNFLNSKNQSHETVEYLLNANRKITVTLGLSIQQKYLHS